ncbi:hypothetical protein MTR_4g074010 [Medicago truncatula]|uniref:Uncharacterized protein n=1 Tax=Medicago truncatula TaxID=3880 RepID=A0A072UXD6_MEDTR|nr:hypothetical protein MTR_4g074010 [Medicago truncatula]
MTLLWQGLAANSIEPLEARPNVNECLQQYLHVSQKKDCFHIFSDQEYRIYVSLTVQLRIAKTIQPAKGRKGLCIIISITAKDDEKYVHIATPHPMKKGGKTSQNAAKDQTSNSSKSASFKAGQQNNKSKQGRQ